MKKIAKPQPGEFPPYASMYIDLLPNDGLVLECLSRNLGTVLSLVESLSSEQLLHSYSSGKWTVKELLVHIIDDERIYAYRALRFARNDSTRLPGFDQDDFTLYSGANERDITNILAEYSAVRQSTIALFAGLSDAALLRWGVANDTSVTVRALAYHIAGHEMHHFNILRERYLVPIGVAPCE